MSQEVVSVLLRQLDLAWQLTEYHLTSLTTEECLWRPGLRGLHVVRDASGRWRGEWPDSEGYELGPSSIAWTTWHIGFWWSMALNHCFGDATLAPDQVYWPGDADGVREWLAKLRTRWLAEVSGLTDNEMQETSRSRWPIQDRPFSDVVAWVNIELMKNASELGYARFLYAVRE